jgi:hypothetical protein
MDRCLKTRNHAGFKAARLLLQTAASAAVLGYVHTMFVVCVCAALVVVGACSGSWGTGCGATAINTTLGYGDVAQKADALAVTAYFGCGLGQNGAADALVRGSHCPTQPLLLQP